MNNKNNLKQAAANFISLFDKNKIILACAITSTIFSIIISIIIPLKTGFIVDSIIDNIKTKNTNSDSIKLVESFIPFIKEIETINFDALSLIDENASIKDLIKYGLINSYNINLISSPTKEKLLKTEAQLFDKINCYECTASEDYIDIVNEIHQILNINKIPYIKNKHSNISENIIFVIILVILSFLLNYITNLSMSKLSKEITANLRSKTNRKIYKIPLDYYTNNKQGNILSLITNDIENISSIISTDIIDIINSLILFIGLLFAMFSLSIKLTLIILGIIPILFIILILNIIKSSKYFKAKQDSLGEYNDYILNSYRSHKVIRSYNQKETFIKKEQDNNNKLYNNTWKSNFYGSLMQPIIEFSGNINFLIVCVFGGVLVINGNLTIGTLQAFLNYAKSFNKPLINIASTISIIEEALASTQRICDFLAYKEETNHSSKKISLKGNICFNDLYFAYTDNNPVLKNINLNIKKGQKIAIVGETGSGKTTLIKLLLGFYEIKKGSILINDENINNINKKDLRESIGIVLQDSWLFNGTIKENINYGSKENFELVKKACKQAYLDGIINKLPNKYDFLVDNNKNNLSNGEKQLVSIARLFMKNKDILILDEATSNLDLETENKIKKSIYKLMKNKTCLIIAHRLSTIINSDKIIVMHNGKIVEEGTHKELLKNKGYYYKIYKSQFK